MNLNKNNKIRQILADTYQCRHVCTTFRQEFIAKLFYFEKNPFSEDFTSLHTVYKDAVAGLIIQRYNDLLEKYKIFKKVGFYDIYKNKTIDADKLLQIKKETYNILRNFYNNEIMPVLQELNDDSSCFYNVYPIKNYIFRPLKDRSHMII